MRNLLTLHPILSGLAMAAATHAPRAHAHHAMSPVMAFFFHLGIVGIFLVAIVDSSFVPLPIPAITDILLIVYAAAHENVFLLLTMAVAGSVIGGLLSHGAGQAGGMRLLQKYVSPKVLARVTRWVEEHSLLSVALPALLPPPTPLTPFLLVAGAVHMSRRKFVSAFAPSRAARYVLSLWIGVHYGRHFLRLWNRFSARWGNTILIALWTFVIVFTAIGIWRIWRTSRAVESPTTDDATLTPAA